jgi:uncharacterized MnhB-related membrane protein
MTEDKEEEPTGDQLLGRLRLVAVIVTLALFALVVVSSILGPFLAPDYRLSEVLLGTLVGTLLTLLGLVALPNKR